MKTVTTVSALRAELDGRPGTSIGLVPTMGALHEGHMSLVRASRAENDLTVVSVFVNPLQFGPSEDFTRYPRNLAQDARLLAEAGADLLFAPTADEIYPPGHQTLVSVTELERELCGKSRPGHFRGVATVVLSLFHIVSPRRAYFGTKDAQQAILIARMV
ncbi:MAG TPA: pantoate--beta-alanine ligase, partial [Candidatus Aminicenantes bacterium]|nr:pantoate--beta-alanine ligase [Candidatus Aminicenantes bacterium]